MEKLERKPSLAYLCEPQFSSVLSLMVWSGVGNHRNVLSRVWGSCVHTSVSCGRQ